MAVEPAAAEALNLGGDPLFKSGMERMAGLDTQRKDAQKSFDAQSGGIQKKLETEQKAGAALEVPKQVNVDEKFEHKGLKGEELTQATTVMFALAALGGAMTRAPMTASLTAFAGAMNGLVKGDHETFQRESQAFDRNLRVAIGKNKQAMDEYNAAFQKHRGNMQDLMNEWNIIAKRHGDTVSSINMERQDIAGMLKHLETQRRMDIQANQIADRFKLLQQQIDEKVRHDKSQEEIARSRIAAAQAKQEAAAKKGGELGLKGKQLDSYIHNTSNIEAIDEIVKALDENPDAVGFKTMLPGIILNRADAEGTPVRASMANITSMTIKDRAGTAQTASEMKNIAPFVPRDGDDYGTVVKKLRGMQREMKRMNDTAVSASGGHAGAGGETPSVNAKGWKLHTDKNGAKAYVGPNNEIEEVK